MAALSSSQCSGSSAELVRQAATANRTVVTILSFESFDSESEISSSREVVSLLNRLKSSSPADMHGN